MNKIKMVVMERSILKQVVLEQQDHAIKQRIIERDKFAAVEPHLNTPYAVIVTGIRRCGKSTFLKQLLDHYYPDEYYHLNFEDERLLDFSVEDFNQLYAIFIELYGKKTIFFFDEIQNIPRWEVFVRRMQDKGFKFFITGSNASLLSQETGTRLTGRNIIINLYPFSFGEYLKFIQYEFNRNDLLVTEKQAELKSLFTDYLANGGMPEYLQYNDLAIIKGIYDDIIYRDVVARYKISEIKALRELSLYLISNVAKTYSYNNLKKILELGSINTVKNYIQYLENSYLYFSINCFSYSLKQQNLNKKKIYCIDTLLINSVAFKFSPNSGQILENTVFLELKRREYEIFYYKTKNNLEVDFLIRQGAKIVQLIQVSDDLHDAKTKNREIKALLTAMQELKCDNGLILTGDHQENLEIDGYQINIKPIYSWILSGD
jgi:predicted AAA+ superfamily ATPase